MSIHDSDQLQILDDLDQWEKMYAARAQKYPTRYGHLHQLLYDFVTFARTYFEYIENEIIAKDDYDPAQFSPGSIRYQAMGTITEEWANISQVVEQRELQRYETWLLDADEEAVKYLPAGFSRPVSYLGKANLVRHTLYSTVPVISFPRHQYGGNDFMAAPHEAGHVLFWNLAGHEELAQKLTYLNDEVDKICSSIGNIPYLANLMKDWLDEIFADTYGALVAGASFPESLVENFFKRRIGTANELFENDGQHPVRYLRPFLRAKALELNGQTTEADALREDWATFASQFVDEDALKRIQISGLFLQDNDVISVPFPLSVVEEALFKIVEYLFGYINSQLADYTAHQPDFGQFITSIQDPNQPTINLLLRPLSRIARYNSYNPSHKHNESHTVTVHGATHYVASHHH